MNRHPFSNLPDVECAPFFSRDKIVTEVIFPDFYPGISTLILITEEDITQNLKKSDDEKQQQQQINISNLKLEKLHLVMIKWLINTEKNFDCDNFKTIEGTDLD